MRGCAWRAIRSLRARAAETLRLLLYLFERDDAIKLMRAG